MHAALLKLLTLSLSGAPQNQPDQGDPWRFVSVFAECSIGMLVLWLRPSMSLRSLRLWEAIHLVTVAAFYGWMWFESLAYFAWLAPDPFMSIGFSGAATLFGYATIILAYGVLIPNTRRRSLVGVTAITAVPFLAIIAAATANPMIRADHVVPLTVQAAAYLAFPAAIAVFAAARATALQRRA